MAIDPVKVAEDVSGSRKYRHLCNATIARVAGWAVGRSRSHPDAVKRTKRKLHQVYAAYLADWDPRQAAAGFDELPARADAKTVRPVCRQLMSMHASTRERLPALETLYGSIFHVTGRVSRLLDVGCGLGPLALPWMGLPAETEYVAWEIDRRLVELIGRFFGLVGQTGGACCRDILVQLPAGHFDVALIMKMLPCLEQQDPGCGRRLLREIDASFLVVSFPVRSIGGKDVGMIDNYMAATDGLLSGSAWPVTRIDCEHELVLVIDKRSG